jgi:hypothetical protein
MILASVWVFADRIGPDQLAPQPATAADVKAKVATAMTDLKALGGTLIVTVPTGVSNENTSAEASSDDSLGSMTWTFLITARGDFRLTSEDGAQDIAYDAGTGREQSLWDRDGEVVAGERTGLASGPPDPHASNWLVADWVLNRGYASYVRALLDTPDFPVEETGYAGRAAWRVQVIVASNLIVDTADNLDIVVDQVTGFPVKVVATLRGEFVEEVRLENLEVDPSVTAADFTLTFPPGHAVSSLDEGFRRVGPEGLADLESIVGYRPLVPQDVPEGFRLVEASIAEQGASTGVEGMNPAARGVVSLTFRRGFDSFTVSTRLVGSDSSPWSDPLATGEGYVDVPETFEVAAGALQGGSAELLIDPRGVPHVWALGERLVVTVAGDLTRGELVRVLQSLAPAAS